jgi:hypothetical protein
MVTKGQVSLDVEDNLDAFSWPELKDMTSLDLIKHSVHFPLIPNQGTWPAGTLPEGSQGGAARVLHIVVPQARLLSSRERCPYLVRLEIAETGLDGSDARLYAAGAPRLGVTVAEALCSISGNDQDTDEDASTQQSPLFNIPPELFLARKAKDNATELLRGGWQEQPNDCHDYMHTSPYDAVRQHEYEQLHSNMRPLPSANGRYAAPQHVER